MDNTPDRCVTVSRDDPGNIDHGSHEVEGRPGAFVVPERWDTHEAFEGHLKAPRRQEPAPRLMELLDGSADAGVRFLWPFRPAG